MQNLEIKYDLNCSQVDYLSQFHLLDENQTTEDPQEEVYSTETLDGMFLEVEDEGESSQERLDFDQFMEEKIKIVKTVTNRRAMRAVKTVVLVTMGEFFELWYLRSGDNTKRKKEKGGENMKEILLLHLLTILACLWMFPLTTMLLLISLILFQNIKNEVSCDSKFTSALLEHESIQKQFSLSTKQLKVYYLTNQQLFSKHKTILDRLLEQLISDMGQSYRVETKKTAYFLDDLDEVAHRVIKNTKERALISHFVVAQGWLQRKIRYWMVVFQNNRMKNTIGAVEKVLSTVQVFRDHQQETKIKKQALDIRLYLSIILKNIEQLQQIPHPSSSQKQQMKNLLFLLQKQLQFHKILNTNRLPARPEAKEDSIPSELSQNLTVFTLNSKVEEQRALCYLDDLVEEYRPEERDVIKDRLEKMVRERKKKEEGEKQEQLQKVKKERQETHWLELKKERKVFGIPILPPKRDMSEYYLQ